MKRVHRTIIKLVIGLYLIFYIFYKIGFFKIIQLISQINIWFIPIVLGTLIIGFGVSAFNIKLLSGSLRKISLIKALKYYLLSWSLGLFAPGKLGEISLVYFLKKEGFTLGEGFAISLLDKIITFLVASILAVIGLFIFFNSFVTIRFIILLIILFSLIFGGLSTHSRMFIKKVFLGKYAYLFNGFSKSLSFFLRSKKRILSLNVLLTFIKWSVNAFLTYSLFISLGNRPSYISVLLITGIIVLVSIIPISLSGLGLREGTMILVYTKIGISAEVVAAVAFLYLIINYISAGIIFSVYKLN